MNFEKQPPPLLDALSERLLAQTPLHFACYTGDGHLLDTLIGNTLLYNNNCEQAAESCVAALISEEDTINGWTPAHWAAFYGHLSCLMKLNVRPSLGFDTPSHRSNTSPLHLCAQSGSVLCLKWLLQCGSSKNRQDFMGETALHKAAKAGNLECANMLVSHGASLELKNHRGLTPADLAEQSDHTALADHLRQVAEEAQCSGMKKYESIPAAFSALNDSMPTTFPNHHPSMTQPKCTGMSLLAKQEQNSKHSYILMNGEDIHNSFSTESCDMDQGDSGIILTDSSGGECVVSHSSWSKKRSCGDFEDIDVQSYKRRCFASQKNLESRYGDAYNNNTISSYSADLATQLNPMSHKTLTDHLDTTRQATSPAFQQSSMMEHEESVIAQHGYDSTFMSNFANAFH